MDKRVPRQAPRERRPRSALRLVSAALAAAGLVWPTLPAACELRVDAIVGIAHRAAFVPSQGRPTLCSVRRHLKQQGLPAKLFSSPNRGGVPGLGGHLRQVVRWQCDRCDPSARLFLADRRRRRLSEQSCDWRRAPQRGAAVRRCAAVACAATRPLCARRGDARTHDCACTLRPAVAHVGTRSASALRPVAAAKLLL